MKLKAFPKFLITVAVVAAVGYGVNELLTKNPDALKAPVKVEAEAAPQAKVEAAPQAKVEAASQAKVEAPRRAEPAAKEEPAPEIKQAQPAQTSNRGLDALLNAGSRK